MELVKEAGEEAALILENGINPNSSLSKKKDGNFFNIVVNDDADIATSRPVFFLYYLRQHLWTPDVHPRNFPQPEPLPPRARLHFKQGVKRFS